MNMGLGLFEILSIFDNILFQEIIHILLEFEMNGENPNKAYFHSLISFI